MADLLSREEHFEDRLEITGYFTSGVASIFLLIFFGMIFFYKPVQNLPPITQLFILLISIFLLTIGFFIPRGNNAARILFRIFFLWFGAYTYFKSIEQGQWFYLPLLLYSAYILWVLGHPVGIQFFRKLKPHEEKQKPVANWLTLHGTVLLLASCIAGLKGAMIISSTESDPLYDPDLGMLSLFLSLVFLFLLFFFRRMKNWARWCLILLSLTLGVFGIPETISTRITSYISYWKILTWVFYCVGLALYLIFSRKIQQAFRTAPPKTA
ncbi:hypothetical protein K8S19_04190 [bacterium]|nr:hypothetical protein [bacterium]